MAALTQGIPIELRPPAFLQNVHQTAAAEGMAAAENAGVLVATQAHGAVSILLPLATRPRDGGGGLSAETGEPGQSHNDGV